MPRRLPLLSIVLGLAFANASCAPQDEPTGKNLEENQAPEPVANLPKHLQGRVDEALKNIQNRTLLKEHSAWTIFHGILGMGPKDATLFDSFTGKRVNALDYICKGGEIRGLKFIEVPGGVDIETQAGSGVGQGHQDQFIAEVAEWGFPLDRTIRVNGKDRPFSDFVNYARRRARIDDNQELSWALVIVSQYFGTEGSWTNLANQKITLEDMVRYELHQPIADCKVCGGTHRLFGLTWAYHLHRARGGKKDGVWNDVEATIKEYKERAREYQNKDGSFSTSYFEKPGKSRDTGLRLASSGHILEWLALALSDAELRQPWMQDAANAVAVMILENRDRGLEGGALYHAAHGLVLYRERVFGAGRHDGAFPLPPKD